MRKYSDFFKTLHDEQAPTGTLGRGTHYSILRAVAFGDSEGKMLGSARFADFAVIWDEDHDDRYSYLTTWLGEHQNESDMAFYSTQPFEHLVGPGIGRAEYGGFLMTLPPRRMIDLGPSKGASGSR